VVGKQYFFKFIRVISSSASKGYAGKVLLKYQNT
jgi:hypothetical protein